MLFRDISQLVEGLVLTGYANPAPYKYEYNFVEHAANVPAIPATLPTSDAQVLTCLTGWDEVHGTMVSVSLVDLPEGATLAPEVDGDA